MGRPEDTGQGVLEEVASELGLVEWVGSQHMELTKESGHRKGKERRQEIAGYTGGQEVACVASQSWCRTDWR